MKAKDPESFIGPQVSRHQLRQQQGTPEFILVPCIQKCDRQDRGHVRSVVWLLNR